MPLSIAASLLELTDLTISSSLIPHYVIAIGSACIVTLLVTKWFRKIVNEGKLIYFSIYCFVVGLLTIIFL